MQFSRLIKKFSDFQNLLATLSSETPSCNNLLLAVNILESCLQNDDLDYEHASKLSFLTEQLFLFRQKPQKRRYTEHILVQAIMLHSLSPSCYEALRENNILTLPRASSLRRITHSFRDENFDDMKHYLTARRNSLNRFEPTVTLIFDEMYVSETIEY